MQEETGLIVSVERLLYVAEKPEDALVHITFRLVRKAGNLRLPSNVNDANAISAVQFVPTDELENYGFSPSWRLLVATGFPNAPAYVGHKRAIGL